MPVATLMCVGIVGLGYLLITVLSRTPVSGAEGLVDEVRYVIERIAPVGKVRVHGEIWTAESDEPLEVGDAVRIRTVENLRLRVRPL
jgi:membrane-bound serine protease (ClpP class)